MNENTNWKNIEMFADREVFSNEKSYLLKFPADSEFKDYRFWYPAKLVRKSRSGKLLSIGYTEYYKTKIFKEELVDGKYTKTDEKELPGAKLAAEFASMDAKIKAYKNHDAEEDARVEVYAEKTSL